ncbi:MAG: hypothetical protein ABIH59_00930 [archaeon]
MESKLGVIVFFIYLILGVYFINMAFGFFQMPEFVLSIDKWIGFAAGILLVVGAINYLRASKKKYMI